MKKSIADAVQQRGGNENLISILSEDLSGTELNSLLLEVFARRSKKLAASELLRQYQTNRFVVPAETNYLTLLEKTAETLRTFERHGFLAQHLSPLVPIGTCSAMGVVDQDKVVSALRGTEVLADATNALALYVCSQRKKKEVFISRNEHIKYCASQRHVRAQVVNIKGYSPHFSIGCLVSAGVDTGNFSFERKALTEHFSANADVLKSVFGIPVKYFKLQKRSAYPDRFLETLLIHLREHNLHWEIRVDANAMPNNYYQGLQFKVIIELAGREFEIADGGFVDWTQKLLSNRKERFCISGFGLELLIKFSEGRL